MQHKLWYFKRVLKTWHLLEVKHRREKLQGYYKFIISKTRCTRGAEFIMSKTLVPSMVNISSSTKRINRFQLCNSLGQYIKLSKISPLKIFLKKKKKKKYCPYQTRLSIQVIRPRQGVNFFTFSPKFHDHFKRRKCFFRVSEVGFEKQKHEYFRKKRDPQM